MVQSNTLLHVAPIPAIRCHPIFLIFSSSFTPSTLLISNLLAPSTLSSGKTANRALLLHLKMRESQPTTSIRRYESKKDYDEEDEELVYWYYED
ncbi:hypothetical protein L5515_016438 [Caenorhabditis briggsae]|uniref:Uncharacterized protein n=1 Tax=Caenorhabditis briggsae TaxID=6238 RepID=A0AAE9FB62_CAEBR|nr:hypothetical protein L5515_016438 [Caenorhabditis briggsae]